MNRRTLLAGLITSPILAWFGFKAKSLVASPKPNCGDEEIIIYSSSPYEYIKDGDCGTLLYYDFHFSESKRIKTSPNYRFIDSPPSIILSLTYLKDNCEITWDWHCINPKFDGYPFNIKKFIASPQMDKNGIRHSHSNALDIPYRMYGPNKFLLSSIAITNPFGA